MATKHLKNLTLNVQYQKGEDGTGNPIIKSQSFSKVNLEATPATLNQFANKLSEVLNFPVTYVGTEESYKLLSEEA